MPVGWGPPPFFYTPYVAVGSSYLSLSLCDWFLRYTFLLLPSCVNVVQRLGQTALVFVRRSGVKAALMKQVSEASPADPQVVLVWEKVDSPKFPLLGSDVAVSTECVGIGRWKDRIPASRGA